MRRPRTRRSTAPPSRSARSGRRRTAVTPVRLTGPDVRGPGSACRRTPAGWIGTAAVPALPSYRPLHGCRCRIGRLSGDGARGKGPRGRPSGRGVGAGPRPGFPLDRGGPRTRPSRLQHHHGLTGRGGDRSAAKAQVPPSPTRTRGAGALAHPRRCRRAPGSRSCLGAPVGSPAAGAEQLKPRSPRRRRTAARVCAHALVRSAPAATPRQSLAFARPDQQPAPGRNDLRAHYRWHPGEPVLIARSQQADLFRGRHRGRPERRRARGPSLGRLATAAAPTPLDHLAQR